MAKYEFSFRFGSNEGDDGEVWIPVFLSARPGVHLQFAWITKNGKELQIEDAFIYESFSDSHDSEVMVTGPGNDRLLRAALDVFKRTWRERQAQHNVETTELLQEVEDLGRRRSIG